MKETPEARRDLEHDDDELDDIEILEVVGMDDDAPPSSEESDDEVEVAFQESAAESSDERPALQQAPSSSVAVAEDEPLRERLLRLQADFENFKKRVDRERDDYYRHATSTLVGRLLPVIDNLERALATEPRSEGEQAFQQGVALILRQLLEELRREGLTPMDSIGEPFDPARHEAVATSEDPAVPANTVVQEIQRGYFFRDRVLRPAAVKVSVDASADAADDGGEEES